MGASVSLSERKTARIKDVNKSQGKFIANLASLVCLYFYYMALSRSFLEMLKKTKTKTKILFLVLNLTHSQQRYCSWSSVPGEQPLETFLLNTV